MNESWMEDVNEKRTWRTITEWAKKQKRVTNYYLRKNFDLNEEGADEVYKQLKSCGYIQGGGYVIWKEDTQDVD